MKQFTCCILLILSLFATSAHAQIKVKEQATEADVRAARTPKKANEQPTAKQTQAAKVEANANDEATANEPARGVVMHADPRLAILLKKYRNVQLGVIRSGHGYRVQIYNGNDRVKANDIRVDFMRRYPNVRTYLTYVQPQFRVKVGDFSSRGDAFKFYAEVSNIYDPSMIVPDIIVVNTLRDD